MAAMERTSVQVSRAEHAGLLRAQLDLSRQAGRRLTLAEVIAELLRSWDRHGNAATPPATPDKVSELGFQRGNGA